jgi:hypothetical protein
VHLRRHVFDGSCVALFSFIVLALACYSEVHHFDLLLVTALEEDVLQLKIAMDDSALVARTDGPHDLLDEAATLHFGQFLLGFHVVAQFAPTC